MTASMPWVKLYTEMLDDPKVGGLTEVARWRFVQMILLAGECDAEGLLANANGPLSVEDIAWRLRLRCQTVVENLKKITLAGLMEHTEEGWRVTKFSERQGRSQSEKREMWRNRQQKRRDTSVTEDSVTRESRVSHAPRVEKNREEKKDTTAPKAARSPKPDYYPIANALATVCHMSLEANRGMIFKAAETLSKANPPATPDLIIKNYNGDARAFWNAVDWRGKKGEWPNLGTIKQTWGQWGDVPTNNPAAAELRSMGYTGPDGKPI